MSDLQPIEIGFVPVPPRFTIGRVICTDWINDSAERSPAFWEFVVASMKRYMQCDWGDTCPKDAEQNNLAWDKTDSNRLLAVYNLPLPLQRPKLAASDIMDRDGQPVQSIWIITEYDHSVTTVLFPSEY